MYYAIKLETAYDGRLIEGLYAGKNQYGLDQLALHEEDEFMQYPIVEGAQEAAAGISSAYKATIVDSEGNAVA